MTRLRTTITLFALVVGGAVAVATSPAQPEGVTAEGDTVIVRKRVRVPPRPPNDQPPEARTAVFEVDCPDDYLYYTAVSGEVYRARFRTNRDAPPPDRIVVVASQAGVELSGRNLKGGWTFELSNYGQSPIEVDLVITCVKDAPRPPRYILVMQPWSLRAGEIRRAQVPGPRFMSPLGFNFRVRSANGSAPPPRNGRVEVLTAQPQGGGYRVAVRNVGTAPVRVEAGGIFVETRSEGLAVARTRVVSAARSVPGRSSVAAAVTCARGSRPVTSGWSLPRTGASAAATLTARGFLFRASNSSTVAQRVRFFGVCLTVTAPGPEPFVLGPRPVPAAGAFENGTGGCPVATRFTDTFLFFAPGDGTLEITQPTTGDRVRGAIAADGTFELESARETYIGRITGNRAAARYSYTTPTGCVETYDVTFVLELGHLREGGP